MNLIVTRLLLLNIFLLPLSGAYAWQNQAPLHSGSDDEIKKAIKKREKGAMVIAFDESGQMIRFPKQVIKRNQVVVFKVRVSKSTVAKNINNFFKRVDNTYNYFLKEKENQFVLWSLFGSDEKLVLDWIREMGLYRGFRQDLPWDSLYDFSVYNRRLNDGSLDSVLSFNYIPVKLFLDHFLNKQFVVKTHNQELVVNRIIPLSPALLKLKADNDDCYWWYSERFQLDSLLGSNCTDCNDYLPFILVKNDPLKATVADWYNTAFKLNCAETGQNAKDSLEEHLNYLFMASDTLAKEPALDSGSKTIIKLFKQTVESIRDSLGKQNSKIDSIMEHQNKLTLKTKQGLILLLDELMLRNGLPFNEQIQVVRLRIDQDSVLTDSLKSVIGNLFRTSIQQYFLNRFIIMPILPSKIDNLKINITEYLRRIREIRCWLFKWLWYNNGWLVINPLPLATVPSADISESITNQLKDSTSRLNALQQQLAFLDSSRVHIKPERINLAELERIQKSADSIRTLIDSVNKNITSLNKRLEVVAKAKTTAENSKKQAGITGIQAYSGQIPIFGHSEWYRSRWLLPGRLTVLQQFSYSASRKSITSIYKNERQKMKFSEIPENEKALMAIHNIPVKAKLEVTHALGSYNDMEEFTVLFQKLLKGLDSTGILQMAFGNPLNGFSNFLKNIIPRRDEDTLISYFAKVKGMGVSALSTIDTVTFTYLRNSAIHSPVAPSAHMSVQKQIEPKTYTDTGFISSFIAMPDSTAPYIVTSTIIIDSIKAKTTLRVGALHRIQLIGGFALVKEPVQQVSIDTTGSGFKTSSASNGSSAILGVKIFPFRTYLRDGGLLPRYPLKRISVLVTVAVPRPLDNFYVGGGYDIVPGLTYNMGINIYKQNYYQIQNAAIIKSSSRYTNGGIYYGLTVNPVIFVQFVKLFFN